jgi:16S rRNA (adenine1518-N6/adenine1519-N6)-dimethyltransferase
MSMSTHIPRKRFGQHFLADQQVVRAIVQAIAPKPAEHMVEIGPGLGVLTAPLLDRLHHLHVIEIDRDLAAHLRTRYAAERLSVHEGNVLDFDFASLPAPLRIVGNLPYNMSTELLFHLLHFSDRIVDAHFMLQREVVDRMVASASSAAYGRLSVMLQYRYAMEKIIDVPPQAFKPPPKVESAVVRMQPRTLAVADVCDERLLAQVVTAAFTKRRKTLRNALEGTIDEAGLQRLGIDPKLRPENLQVSDYLAIARALEPAR